jgi:F-type H+-transporting ATPase subunit b
MTRLLPLLVALFPATALASDDPSVIPWNSIILQGVNLFLLLAVLTYLARNSLKEALKNRSKTIETHLEESNKMRREAQDRFDQLDARLSRIGGEVDKLQQDAVASAKKEAAMIREEAEAEALRIQEAAEKAIRDEVQAAKVALQREAAGLALGLAEEKIQSKVTDTVQDRLDSEFLGSVKKEANGHG